MELNGGWFISVEKEILEKENILGRGRILLRGIGHVLVWLSRCVRRWRGPIAQLWG